MVQFGRKIASSLYKPWHSFYLDYNLLKNVLTSSSSGLETTEADGLGAAATATCAPSAASILGDADSKLASADFRRLLDREIEKVVLFILQKQGELASRLSELRARQAEIDASIDDLPVSALPDCLSELRTLGEEYHVVGRDLLHFVHFVDLNVIAVRKILKKHDKVFSGSKLSKRYLYHNVHEPDSHLRQLYDLDGICALVTTIRLVLMELNDMEYLINERRRAAKSHRRTSSEPLYAAIQNDEAGATVANGNSAFLKRSDSYQATHELERSESFTELETVLEGIIAARQRLVQSKKYVEVVAAQSVFGFDDFGDGRDGEADVVPDTRSRTVAIASNILNLCSTFLYMTNYYIIVPTSGMYAEKLGSSESLSGIMIGMTPIAALFSTVLYSWWTSRSYKAALLFAASCSLVGNVLYVLALPYDSLGMVIAGRLLNGFGSARSINRRYIADTYSRLERTAASAAFVTAGALGMAAGPAIAAVLGYFPASDGNDFWTVETSPGWVMFVLWAIFFVSTVLLFKDPDRRHHVRPEMELSGEMRPMLPSATSQRNDDVPEPPKPALSTLWSNVPVMTTLVLYFILKLVLECLLSSTALLTSFYFDWDMQLAGTYLAILGLLMFPANLCVAYFSYSYEDREIMMATLLMMLVGIMGFICYGTPESYSVLQYVPFGVTIFVSTNALEGPNMSLLSKTIPRSLARGTINTGLLATEAGTFGRAVGDMFISATGYYGIQFLLNFTFLPLGFLVLVTVFFTWRVYDYLEPEDEHED